MDSEYFKVEIAGSVARCSMDNPEDMNALSVKLGYPMAEELTGVLAD